jgi:hypothetical protein
MACITIMQVRVKFQFAPVIFNPTYHFTNVHAREWEYAQRSEKVSTWGTLVSFTHGSDNFLLRMSVYIDQTTWHNLDGYVHVYQEHFMVYSEHHKMYVGGLKCSRPRP